MFPRLFLKNAEVRKNVLNPWLLKPGAILVDDSFPPLLSIKDSIDRMKTKKDVLILSGGRMKLSSYTFQSPLWQIPKWFFSFFIRQVGHQGLPGCWLSALLAEKLEEFLNSNQKSKSKGSTKKKSGFLPLEESEKFIAKSISLKPDSLDKKPRETEFTAKALSEPEKLLKVWDLREALDLILPDYHLFKYKIPTETVDRVLSLRKS